MRNTSKLEPVFLGKAGKVQDRGRGGRQSGGGAERPVEAGPGDHQGAERHHRGAQADSAD